MPFQFCCPWKSTITFHLFSCSCLSFHPKNNNHCFNVLLYKVQYMADIRGTKNKVNVWLTSWSPYWPKHFQQSNFKHQPYWELFLNWVFSDVFSLIKLKTLHPWGRVQLNGWNLDLRLIYFDFISKLEHAGKCWSESNCTGRKLCSSLAELDADELHKISIC